jgi:hypothetical protein
MDGEERVSIMDIRDKSGDPDYKGPLYPTSPCSIEAYQALGTDPLLLKYHPMSFYQKKYNGRPDLAKIEHDHCYKRRQDAFAMLMAEREKIKERKQRETETSIRACKQASDLNEMMKGMALREQQRLEHAKRQQEKEIQRIRSMEKLRKQTEEKMALNQRAIEERQMLKEAERRAMERKRMQEKRQKMQQHIQVRWQDVR